MSKKHSDEERAACCAPKSAPLDCCQPTEGESPCCNPGNGKSWRKGKSLVSAVVILAAIGVGANTIIKARSVQADSSSFSSFVNEKSEKSENSKAGQQATGPQFSFNRVMDSLQAIDAQATDKEVVFIALPIKGQELSPTVSKQMEAILFKLPPSCQKVGAYTLNTSAADYDRLVQRLEIKTFPCFVVLGRQGAPAVIPADGDVSDAQTFKAYLTASMGDGCCRGTSKAICCPTK